MHMSDALITPVVGGVMLAASAGVAAYSIKSMKNNMEDSKIPLMGVAGAFVFAAQMINFAIPATGSSGHIGGALLLAALIGAGPGFVTMGAILLIQALFFADGGLVAFGCNWFNMGFFGCFIAYPLIYKRICRGTYGKAKIMTASVLASVAGLQLGAFCVVLQTLVSGITELPFNTFVLFMQPIHLAIGFVEGLITGAVLCFVHASRPELLDNRPGVKPRKSLSAPKVVAVIAVCALLAGGILSSFASGDPDGLEWSMSNTIGQEASGGGGAGGNEPEATGGVFDFFGSVQEKTAILPDYGFGGASESAGSAVDAGTALSGIVGSLIVLAVVGIIGFIVVKTRKKVKPEA